MSDSIIKTWDTLIQELFEGSFNKDLHRYRSPYAFRGQPSDYDLIPGLMRLNHPFDRVSRIEKHLFNNFKKYAHQRVSDKKSDWYWMSLAQHHGLPTRLLDWTYSPFVALHFATDDLYKMNEDGVIWCVNFRVIQRFLHPELRDALQNEDLSVFSIEMLEEKFQPYSKFDSDEGSGDFVLFFEPPSLDERIINQVALFSFTSRPNTKLNEWLQSKVKIDPHVYKKITFSKDLKWEIRDKLDQANVNERVLFPGLDGLSSWLKRWYSPLVRPKGPNPVEEHTPSAERHGIT
jgi:hypothetical protein